jgi:hypothetical protein
MRPFNGDDFPALNFALFPISPRISLRQFSEIARAPSWRNIPFGVGASSSRCKRNLPGQRVQLAHFKCDVAWPSRPEADCVHEQFNRAEQRARRRIIQDAQGEAAYWIC